MNNYVDEIYSSEIGESIKGFVSIDKIEKMKNNASVGYVMLGMEYRPDKISSYYLGSVSYAWLITLINGFDNGIEDYYLGREILIPDLSSLSLVNI